MCYVRHDRTCFPAKDLESLEFSTTCLKFHCYSFIKFISVRRIYLSLNSFDYVNFFDKFTSKVGHILTYFPIEETYVPADFNVYHQLWFSLSSIDQPSEHAFNFAIFQDLDQLVQHFIRIPEPLEDTSNILDLFLTSNPSSYSTKLFYPLGFSDHDFISVSCPIALLLPLDPPTRRCSWCYALAKWEDLRMY